jgi:hypothetical protein
MAERSFVSFIAMYLCVVLLLALLEVYVASFSPNFKFNWVRSGPEFRSFLKDATSYYITAQVGALGIVSIAIGLVTLIAQRQNARREIQIYYHESLAREVVASSVALLVVLCVQIFWPVEMLIRQFGLGVLSNNSESALTRAKLKMANPSATPKLKQIGPVSHIKIGCVNIDAFLKELRSAFRTRATLSVFWLACHCASYPPTLQISPPQLRLKYSI